MISSFVCRQSIDESDIKALIAFFETSQDMACVEDVLHMIIRAISQKSLLASFVEQVDSIGGCHVFINLLQRYDNVICRSSEMLFVDGKGLCLMNALFFASEDMSQSDC